MTIMMSNFPTTSDRSPTQAAVSAAFETLRSFLCHDQFCALKELCRASADEHEYFRSLMVALAERIRTMPKTGESASKKPVVFLHYFQGSSDWHITEKDAGGPDDPCRKEGEEPLQTQAFGFANLGYGREMGYISIRELVEHGAELDLDWVPKSLT